MAEVFLDETFEAEIFFGALENEITKLFEELFTSIEDKKKSIFGILDRIREDFKRNEANRLKKLAELNQFKDQLVNTDSQLNDVMEIREDTIHKLDAKISKLVLPEECPKVSLQFEQLENIIAKIDAIQLKTLTEEDPFETDFDSSLEANISIIRKKLQLTDHNRRSLIRHMSTLKRDTIIQTQTRPITDIKIISNKVNVPVGYTALDSTAGGKEVDLWEDAKFRVFTTKPKRILCYTRQTMDALSIKEGTSRRSRIDIPLTDQVVVTDIMVLSSTTKEFIPLDYDVVEYTADQNDLALHNHILLIKYQKKLETENAVSQIMFLGEEQVSCLPPKFSSVNQPINGQFICFNFDVFDDSTDPKSDEAST
eukprot:TRINITY_DN15489_c0_g1_i1.p1 TRINITY_DN15489_c0_g1~~TRINITY_DN15489_c0_g1_i1.p1  ORF type:complete len:368 (-),score=63.77 TRINITY_DN15489_c0_g1_i1:123-1226(-)